ncbi:hypothetical protein COB55_05205 [Candidatus Wolfebacteria bacterium]|nr:MAG: hypothetical protein COB55_05205 [Candidatus Wolfebacteria bacterium]
MSIRIISRILRIVFPKSETPVSTLTRLKPEFQKLREELYDASKEQPLDGIVTFFDVVSKWADRGVRDLIGESEKSQDGLLEDLRAFGKHLQNAGRSSYGWNRTEIGEEVRANQVYLGNIFGLFTKTVMFWKGYKDEKPGRFLQEGMRRMNSYNVVSVQARDFMESHIGPMTTILRKLEAAG